MLPRCCPAIRAACSREFGRGRAAMLRQGWTPISRDGRPGVPCRALFHAARLGWPMAVEARATPGQRGHARPFSQVRTAPKTAFASG